ncbi:hypothetical protein [Lacinutrix sp. 5H-3-7-4]|uniref:hypothetical protein n=1 Tax=Lacinutrix sp. (strain 5H-3-7-4) TaxID=983544 RepID=UPI00020A3CEE|nr:hypothetical protein [Lacinutrix sp. 5H-3-7-4]AEH02475.1 hypothetical protein Lacal_2634 [Lacinutrix sp. 5H-3-7-4]
MKKQIKTLSLIALSIITFNSCSDDDDNNNIEIPVDTQSTRLYTSNNADGNITYYDVTNLSNVSATTLVTASVAADGIYYDASTDAAIQASRSGLALEGFTDISDVATGTTVTSDITGTADMVSPREVAVNGNFYVVADNADVDGDDTTADGRLYIYERSNGTFTLRNTITTDFKLWGITFNGNDLFAVVDTTNQLAVYTDFLSNTTDATVSATKTIAVEGIVRTHGLTYDVSSNTMVLTDIGSAGDATDGGFHVISDFLTKFNNTADGDTLALTSQVRVAGASTVLGNPVDVAYDAETETVFIAEAANGTILAFNNIGTGGDIAPVLNNGLASASAVYLSKD